MADPPLQFGDYEVLSLPDGSPAVLGEGTSGATYKAVQREVVFGRALETFAAVKVIKAGRLEDEAAKGQFFRELKALTQVIHPNVVRYLRQGTGGGADGAGSVWYAMEYCGGGSLQDYARGRGGIPETELVPLAVEAAAGLRAVHDAGFVHCDVKPANLLLDLQPGRRVPVVKVSDFGSVQALRATDGEGVAEGMLSGEPFRGSALYASPEQLKGHRLDGRSDIYSLGISLWHLLLGDRPFLGDLPEVQRWHLGGEPHEPFLPSFLHPGLRRLLAAMVEKDPGRRPTGMGEVVAALRAVQDELAARPAAAAPAAETGGKLEDCYEVDYGRRVSCPMGNRFPARRLADGREVDLLFVHAEQAARPEVEARIRQAVERLGGAEVPAAVAAPLEAGRFGEDLVVACLPAGRATVLDLLKRRGGTVPAEEAVALLAPVAAAADFLQARRVAGLSLRVNDVHLRLFRDDGTAMSDAAVQQALGQGGSGSGVLTRPLVDPLRLPPAGGPGKLRTQVTVDSTGTLSGTVKSSGLPSATDDPRVGFAALLYRMVVGHEVPETVFLTPDAFTPTQRLGGESNALLRDVLARTLNPLPSCAALLREVCEHDGLPVPAFVAAVPTATGSGSAGGTGSAARTSTPPAVPQSAGFPDPQVPESPDPRIHRSRWGWAAAAVVLLALAVLVPGSPLRRLVLPDRVSQPTIDQQVREAEARREAEEKRQREAEEQRIAKAAELQRQREAAEAAAQPRVGTKAGEAWKNGMGTEFRWCPAGEFLMGSTAEEMRKFARDGVGTDNEVRHRVRLTQGFWLSRCEVTQGEWKAVMGTSVREQAGLATAEPAVLGEAETLPMYFVSWSEAADYCRKVTEREREAGRLPGGWRYALPTEAQWEYACRAGTTTTLYNGPMEIRGRNNAPALDPIAWYGGNSSEGYAGRRGEDTRAWPEKQYPGGLAGPREVGTKGANAWGLCDMIGNVWEWCVDWYGPYAADAAEDPPGAARGVDRVARGGSWNNRAARCRAAHRVGDRPGDRSSSLGFRPALVPSGE